MKKNIIWNTNKPGGWQTYNELLEKNEILAEIANSTVDDPEIMMKLIDKEMNNAKYKAFGKVKEKNNDKHSGEVIALQKEKLAVIDNGADKNNEDVVSIDKKLAATLLVKQRKIFELRIKCLIDAKNRKEMLPLCSD